jgi:hypothetical protein
MKIIISYALSSILLLANIGCRSATMDSPTERECDHLISSFFLKSSAIQRQEEFARLDINSKYSVYICGNQKIHPPTVYLAESFSKEGGAVVPFLMDKLLSTKNDNTIRDIIYVFGWMQRLKTYGVASDNVLIGIINKKASEIHDEFWREHVEKEVATIISMSSRR